jgi:hypothetical protein
MMIATVINIAAVEVSTNSSLVEKIYLELLSRAGHLGRLLKI